MAELNVRINFDLDGTIADLYGVEGWLPMLENHVATPYEICPPKIRLNVIARYLNRLQKAGATICVLSWLSKDSTAEYDEAVTMAKLKWLKNHLPSVHWDDISIIPYGTPKENYCFCPTDILFDDEAHNREAWLGVAYDEKNIAENLKNLLTNGLPCGIM